jgi:hypothetical protein
MIIQIDDLIGNREFYDFLTLFGTEFASQGRIYAFSLLCTSADKYKELSNALKTFTATYGIDGTINLLNEANCIQNASPD